MKKWAIVGVMIWGIITGSMTLVSYTLPLQASAWRSTLTLVSAEAAFDCESVAQISAEECKALVAFSTNTAIAQWTTQTEWLQTNLPCNWYGVTCGGNQVTALVLENNHLVGSVPPHLRHLLNLQILALGYNQLSSISARLGELPNLHALYLAGNQFTAIPSELGNLLTLRVLDLQGNQLQRAPGELGNLVNLQALNLAHNQLPRVPSELGTLTQLQTLSLAANQLITVPAELGNLTRLIDLDLSQNQLIALPAELGHLKRVQQLDLSVNQLSGLPLEIGDWEALRALNLSANRLTQLPLAVGELGNLETLNIAANQLVTIPATIGNLSRLQTLDASHNQLQEAPPTLFNLTTLQKLNLRQNQLTGLTPALVQLTNLTSLDLSDNPQLRGALSEGLVTLTQLQEFRFAKTGLCEPMTQAFQNWLKQIATLQRTGLPCQQITINFAQGAPGSSFVISGQGFPAASIAQLLANGVALGLVNSDGNGAFTLTLTSDQAEPGVYAITVQIGAMPYLVGVSLTLAADADLHTSGASGAVFALPAGIGYTNLIHLPFVAAR